MARLVTESTPPDALASSSAAWRRRCWTAKSLAVRRMRSRSWSIVSAASLVRRRQAAGKCRELRLLPARPLILDRPHALGDAPLLVRRLDGLAGERVVGARLDGPAEDDMGAQEEIIVGRAAGGERRGDRELEEQLIGPIGQGRGIDRLSISLLKGAETLPARLDQRGASLVRLARPQQVEADGCLAKGLHFLKPLRIGGPSRRQLQEVAPPLVRRVLQDQAGEFVGDGEVELARIREISPLQDGVAAGLERMRLEQISRGIAVAAQHLGAQQLVVGASTSRNDFRGGANWSCSSVARARRRSFEDLPEVLAVSGQGGAQLQELVGQEAVGRNGLKERLRGGDQTKRALGIVVLQELAGDAHEQGAPHRSARRSSTARWPAPCRGDRARPRSRRRGAIAGRREAAARRRATGCSPR